MARFSQTLFLAPCLLATTLAADDVQKFVAALRERRYHDIAAEYLETLVSDPRRSPEAKQSLLYEQGVVFVDSALTTRDPAALDRQLDLAQEKLRAFLAVGSSHEFALQAQQRLAGVLRTQADLLVKPADKSIASSKAKKDAGKLYDEARGLYGEAAKRLRGQLDELPKDETEKREELGNQWLGARFNAARSMYDLAITRDAKDEKKKLLTEAAGQCDEIYSKFPQRIAGVQARLYEGRCYQELGDRKKALAAFGDLIADLSETNQDARQLKTLAMKHALECWLENKEYAKAVEKAVPWAKSARGAELRDPTWLEVKLSTATALKELAARAGKNDPETRKNIEDARELASDVAKSNQAELKSRGRMLLAQAGRGDPPAAKTAAIKLNEFKTFDEALTKAEELIDEIKNSQLELEYVEKDEKPDPKEIEQLKQTIANCEQQSFQLLKRAVELADQSATPEKLQNLYYLLGYFHYQRGEYLEAALFGEHVARKYPDSPTAPNAARIAMVAFLTSFQKANQAGADCSFEASKLAEIADYVSIKWPGKAEADAAFTSLLTLYINQGDYEKAKATLGRIKDDSPGRAEAEASLGQGLWGKYLRALQELRQQQAGSEGDATTPDAKAKQAELDTLVKEAQAALERGVEVIRKQKDVNPRMMLAALSLAQIYAHTSQADKALKLLEDPKLGPVTLRDKRHSAAESAGIPAEIHKTAMRVYVSVEPPQIDKATAAMEALEKISAQDPEGEAKFTQLLVGVASDLQQQLEELRRSGNDAKQAQQVAAFEQFLRRIPERKSGTDFRTLYWVAITYQKLADGLGSGAKVAKQAQNYYSQASKTFDTILQRERANAGFVPAANLPAVKLQMAKVQSSAGEFDKAIATFAAILKDKPTWLDAQEAAAEAYQRRAATEPKFYVQAIRGGLKGDAAVIWGWGTLGKKTSTNPQYRENFHRARYNMTLCRRRYADTREKEEKTKLLNNAKDDIRITKQFEATLGGETWKPKYDKLLRDIQQALGEQAVGLQEFEQKAAGPAAAAK